MSVHNYKLYTTSWALSRKDANTSCGTLLQESIQIESPQPFNITKNRKLTRIPLEPNDNTLGEVGLRRFSGEARISGELLLVALRGPSLWTGDEAGLGRLKNVPLGGLALLFVLNENGIVALIGWGFVELDGEALRLLWVPCEAMLFHDKSARMRYINLDSTHTNKLSLAKNTLWLSIRRKRRLLQNTTDKKYYCWTVRYNYLLPIYGTWPRITRTLTKNGGIWLVVL